MGITRRQLLVFALGRSVTPKAIIADVVLDKILPVTETSKVLKCAIVFTRYITVL